MTREPEFDVRAIEAEENLLIDAQFLVEAIMRRKGISRTELSKRMGCSKARLSQLLKADANPTVKTIGRLFFALGEEVTLTVEKPVVATCEPNSTLFEQLPSRFDERSSTRALSDLELVLYVTISRPAGQAHTNDNDLRNDDFLVAAAA